MASGESFFVDLAHGPFHGLRWAGPELGGTLLLLHGVNQTAHSWDEVAPRLCDRFTVIAVDQRGHGESAWAKDGDYGLEAMVGDLAELARFLGLRRVAVAGMSMGAAHAIALAARWPQVVSHLVVVDFAPVIEPKGLEAIRHVLGMSWPSFEAAVTQIASFNPRRTVDNVRDRLRHSLGERPGGSWGWRLDPALLRHPRFGDGAMGARDDVEKVRCPTLVVRGDESDILSPEMAEAMIARLRAGRLVTVAGAGHSVAGDDPESFTRAVRSFLLEQGWEMP